MEEEDLSPAERMIQQLDFEGGAYTSLSILGLQLGWEEEEFRKACEGIDIEFLKAKFLGLVLENYTDEELEQTVTMLEKLQDVVAVASEIVPQAVNKYLEDNNMLPDNIQEDGQEDTQQIH